MKKMVVSIVSHGHSADLLCLLNDFKKLNLSNVLFVITINDKAIEDVKILKEIESCGLKIRLIVNEFRKSFAENHNWVGLNFECEYFFVLNPDVRIRRFDVIEVFNSDFQTSSLIFVPEVYDFNGKLFQNMRPYPPFIFGGGNSMLSRFWFSGLGFIIQSVLFKRIGGFDSAFPMYLEDVDMCLRLSYLNPMIIETTSISLQHRGGFLSHKSFKFFLIHVYSYSLFYLKHLFSCFNCCPRKC